MQDSGKLNAAELEEVLKDEVSEAGAQDHPDLAGPPEASRAEYEPPFDHTQVALEQLRARVARLETPVRVRPNDWAETAGKEQLKTATRVERERANRMEKLLADAVDALTKAEIRQLQLENALKESTAPVTMALEKLDAAITKTDNLYNSFVAESQRVSDKFAASSRDVLAQRDEWKSEMSNARVSYDLGVEATRAAHADLVALRDTIHAKLGELNLRLRKASL